MSLGNHKQKHEEKKEENKKKITGAMKDSPMNDQTSKVDQYLDTLMTKLDSPPNSVSQHVEDDSVFVEPVVNAKDTENVVEQEEQTIESSIDDIETMSGQDVNTSSSELILQSNVQKEELESHPLNLTHNDNNNADLEKSSVYDPMKKAVETKYVDTLSPGDVHLKSIHSRENSASSLLEETLESAKTIASIYSVQGPTRSPDGEDSFGTASEMRRHSLAKRVVRRRPKLDSSTFTPEKEAEVSNISAEASLNEPVVTNEGDDDSTGNRSTGSLSSSGSRPDSGVLSPKLEALEEQKVKIIYKHL